MLHRALVALLWLAAVCLALPARAGETEGNERAASRLIETTVTVRSQRVRPETQANRTANEAAAQADPLDGVTVASGVSVGEGLVVTLSHPAARQQPQSVRYRVTLPDGEQTKAAAGVVDQYSGLTLLEIDDRSLPRLELSGELPAIGATILTAAGAGIERPLVSIGIVSGCDRNLGGADLPPLIQCDVLTTEASAGAAIVERSGKLVGVIAAAAPAGQRGGWTYAVPARHVERLLAARQAGQLVVLERRRPIVGLTLGPGAKEGTVEVERIVPGGPADQAGIRQGDNVLEAQGRKLRSAYQAVDLILSRQPGDTMDFVIERGSERKNVRVHLGGGAVAAAPAEQQQQQLNQQLLNVRRVGPKQYEVRGGGNVAEVGADGGGPRREVVRSPGDEVGLLKTQLGAFEKVIRDLQDELRRREELQTQTSATLERLQREMQELRARQPGTPGGKQGSP